MDLYNAYLRLFIYLPLVLFLLYFLLRFLKHLNPSLGHQSRIYVVEKVMISPRVFLLVVRVGEDYLLLSAGASGVTLLKELGSNWQEEFPEQNYKKDFLGVGGLLLFMKRTLSGKRFKRMKSFEEEFDGLTRNLSMNREMEDFENEYFPGKDREK
jgi:flagellar biosynthetic protein FliO